MPIYEYHCQNCDKQTEILQKISDAPATSCPHCGKNELEKLISATSFQLKGNGWYVTDFKGNNKKPNSTSPKKETTNKTSTSSTTE